MNIDNLKPPAKGFTKSERAWIKDVLIPAIMTVHAVKGKNCTITDTDKGQIINADDCAPCP